MSWQDVVLTGCSVVFVVALVPMVLQRQVPPLGTCLSTAAPLTVVAYVDVTLRLYLTSATTAFAALLWWWCVGLARSEP